ADLARPMRFVRHLPDTPLYEDDSEHDQGVPQDRQDREPWRNAPVIGTPGEGAEKHDRGDEKELVSQGVDEGSKLRFLVETSGDPSVDSVGRRRQDKESERGPAEFFPGSPSCYTPSVTGDIHGNHRHQRNPGQCDFARESHPATPSHDSGTIATWKHPPAGKTDL